MNVTHDMSVLSLITNASVLVQLVMAGLLIFSGTQLLILGLIGEYLGRLFLTVNQRPQSIVREVLVSGR